MILIQLALDWLRGPHPERRRPPRDEVVGVSRGSVRVRVDGRTATVSGEMLMGRPQFVAYRGDVSWDDGCDVTDADRQAILGVLEYTTREGSFVVEFF